MGQKACSCAVFLCFISGPNSPHLLPQLRYINLTKPAPMLYKCLELLELPVTRVSTRMFLLILIHSFQEKLLFQSVVNIRVLRKGYFVCEYEHQLCKSDGNHNQAGFYLVYNALHRMHKSRSGGTCPKACRSAAPVTHPTVRQRA